MPVTLTPELRDALFSQVSVNLDVLDDLQTAIEQGDEEECYLLGRRAVDARRLIVDGGLLTLPEREISRIGSLMQRDIVL